MALTRGDKMIIIGAVALAATVVLGLAILKRPGLFSGGTATQVAAVPPAPTAAAPAPSVLAPVGAPAQSSAPAAPVAAAPTPSVPATVSPAPAAPASAAAPVAEAVAPASPATQAAKPASQAAAPGDETLEKMFAEITGDTPAKDKPGKPTGKAAPHGPQAVPATAPAEPAAAPAPPSVTTEPAATETPAPAEPSAATETAPAPSPPAPAKGKGKAKAAKQPEPAAKPAATEPAAAPAPKAQAKAEPAPAPAKAQARPEPKALMAKTQAAAAKPTAASGTVIRVVAEEKPGEYQLVVYTSKPPAGFTKMFLTNPPRLVLDVAGSWKYVGPGASDTGNAFIRHIRVGTHPDKFRVVLDMAPDATARLRGAPTAERVPEGVALRIPK